MRFLTVFTFLQTMHYVVWCYFIPRAGRREAARLEGLVRGGRLALLVGFGVVALAAVFWSDYKLGRTVYGALASYHAYLE